MNLKELQSLYDFTDRTVLVTGGAGVLGLEIVRTLVQCNANVIVLSRNPERITRSIAESIKPVKSKGLVLCVSGDVLNRESLQQANETVKSELGAVDILINAAGGNHPSATTSIDVSFFDLSMDALQHVSDLNLLGTILPCQVFGRGMAERGEGVILNISSMNAFRPLTRIPAYSAGKAAVTNFTQWLAVHMAQNYSPRIRVNAIAPGFFIGEQNRRPATQRTRHSHPLLLTARELDGGFCSVLCQPDTSQKLQPLFLGLLPLSPQHFHLRQRQIVEDGQVWERLKGLEYHADPCAQFRQLFCRASHMHAIDLYFTLLIGFKPVDRLDQCRLTRARRATNHHHFALFDLGITISQNLKTTVPLGNYVQCNHANIAFISGYQTVFNGFTRSADLPHAAVPKRARC